MIIEFNGKKPKIAESAFIAENATIIGDVTIGENCSVMFGSVLRGDESPIILGDNSNIQDNCTVHVESDCPVIIGKYCTIGHNCVLHGCTLGDNVLVGMASVVLNGAVIGDYSYIGACSLVGERKEIPPRSFGYGMPFRFKKEVDENLLRWIDHAPKFYMDTIKYYKK